jgi:hypothetical protein
MSIHVKRFFSTAKLSHIEKHGERPTQGPSILNPLEWAREGLNLNQTVMSRQVVTRSCRSA